jgi:hypothetical protein
MKKTGLPFCALTQGIRSEIDLVAFVIKPKDLVTMVLKFEIIKARWIGPEEFEHLALGKQRPQVDDTSKPVLPNNLNDAEYDRLRTLHGNYVSHLLSPACAVLQPQTMRPSIRPDALPPMLAHD